MKISKIVAIRCQMLTLRCTKLDLPWGFDTDRAGEPTELPGPLAGFKAPTSEGWGGQVKRKWMGKGKIAGKEVGKGKEKSSPTLQCYMITACLNAGSKQV